MAPILFYCQSVVSELVRSLRKAELQSLAVTCREVEPIARAWFPAHVERVRLGCLAALCTARFDSHSGRWVEVSAVLAQASETGIVFSDATLVQGQSQGGTQMFEVSARDAQFSVANISNCFRGGRPLSVLILDLNEGLVHPLRDEFLTLTASIQHRDNGLHFYCANNRRLFSLKQH
ncbi:unnamed protein product [Polarella glacialis]|uniref:Uncharacterized protein n=1 Tax=Polarella glacialis TaxID=89957 RepID=A0A813KSP4_POLGL|nr:unnamed protein product [Polarella glacialis]